MRSTLLRAAAAVVAAIALGISGPATAAGLRATDPADTNDGVDLRAVRVENGDRYVTIVLTHADLSPRPSSVRGGRVYIDTDPKDKGPELVFTGGYTDDAEFELLHTEGFEVDTWKGPVRRGDYRVTLDVDHDKTRMRISRRALGQVGKVRVAVNVGADLPGEIVVDDWLGKPRSFTPWVRRG